MNLWIITRRVQYVYVMYLRNDEGQVAMMGIIVNAGYLSEEADSSYY